MNRQRTGSLCLALLLALAVGTPGALAQMSAERQGSQVVVSTPQFRMVFDEAAGGDVVDFFNFLEDDTAPYTDKVSQSTGSGKAGLFHIGGRVGTNFPGTPSEDEKGISTLHVLEVSDARVRLLNELSMPNGLDVERVFTVYPSGKLYVEMAVSADETIWDFWDKPGGNGALYDFAYASKEERVAIIADNGPESDILDIWFGDYSVGGSDPWQAGSWLHTRSQTSNKVTTAGFGSNDNDANIAAGRYTSRQLVEFLRTDVATNSEAWRRYADDYRNPASPLFSLGGDWDEDGDGYHEGEGVYTLAFPISQQLAFTFDAQGYERIRPSFKAQGFRGLELVALEILKDGSPLTLGVDYFAGVVPFASAWLVAGGAATQVGAGGLPGDAAESLADAGHELSLSGFGPGDALYWGASLPSTASTSTWPRPARERSWTGSSGMARRGRAWPSTSWTSARGTSRRRAPCASTRRACPAGRPAPSPRPTKGSTRRARSTGSAPARARTSRARLSCARCAPTCSCCTS